MIQGQHSKKSAQPQAFHRPLVYLLIISCLLSLGVFFYSTVQKEESSPGRLVLDISCFVGSEIVDSVIISLPQSATPERLSQSVSDHCGFQSESLFLKDENGAFVMLDGSLPSGKYQAFSKLKKKQGRVEDSIPHPPKSESISVPFKAESISVPFKAEIISVPFKAESISHPLKANTGVSHQVAKDFLSLTLPGERLVMKKITTSFDPIDKHKLEFFFSDQNFDNPQGENIAYFLDRVETDVKNLFGTLLKQFPGCTSTPESFNHWRRIGCETRFSKEQDPIVLDIGANAGYYAFFSAALGHKLITIEPQPHCNQWIRMSVLANGLEDRFQVLQGMAGSNLDATIQMEQRTGCWGTWPRVTDPQISNSLQHFVQDLPRVTVPTISVDKLLLDTNAVVLLMKIDVEGSEKSVISSALEMIRQRRILNILMELGVGMWSSRGYKSDEMLQMLVDLGEMYDIRCLNFGSFSIKPPMTLQELQITTNISSGLLSADCWLRLKGH